MTHPYDGAGQTPPDPYQPYGQGPYGQPSYGQQPGAGYVTPGPYTPSPYGPPPGYGYGYVQQTTNGMAIASMVLGILWLYWIGSILALIFGYVARNQMKQRPQQGNGMAIAGIVLGWIGVATLVVLIVAGVAVSSS